MNALYELLANAIDAVLAFYFIRKFTNSNHSIPFFVGMVLHFSCTTYLTRIITFNYATTIVNLTIMILYALTIKNVSKWKRLSAPIIFEVSLIVVNTTFINLTSLVMNKSIGEILSYSVTERYVCMLACKIVLFTLVMLILKLIHKEQRSYTFSDFFVFLIFPVASVYLLFVLMQFGMAVENNKYGILIIIAVFCTAILDIFLYFAYSLMGKRAKTITELELKQAKVEQDKNNYQETQANYEKLRQIKHDINNQLLHIMSYVDGGNLEKATANIHSLQERVNKINNICNTNNETVNFVINSKLANRDDISLKLIASKICLNHIEDVDLISVLSNVIDNAIESINSCETKIIQLEFYVENGFQHIVVKNNIRESVLEFNPKMFTTKKDKTEHGLGVKIIKDIVNSYNGLYNAEEENNMFITHILIPIK